MINMKTKISLYFRPYWCKPNQFFCFLFLFTTFFPFSFFLLFSSSFFFRSTPHQLHALPSGTLYLVSLPQTQNSDGYPDHWPHQINRLTASRLLSEEWRMNAMSEKKMKDSAHSYVVNGLCPVPQSSLAVSAQQKRIELVFSLTH